MRNPITVVTEYISDLIDELTNPFRKAMKRMDKTVDDLMNLEVVNSIKEDANDQAISKLMEDNEELVAEKHDASRLRQAAQKVRNGDT